MARQDIKAGRAWESKVSHPMKTQEAQKGKAVRGREKTPFPVHTPSDPPPTRTHL
jgi:hypothetical protein